MKITAIPAYLLSFGLMIISINFLGIDFRVFYDLPSVLVIICGFIFTLVNFRFSEIYFAFKDALFKTKEVDLIIRYDINKKILNTIGNYVFIASFLSFLISLVTILEKLESFNHLGGAFALALLSIIYAFFIKYIILTPLSISLDKKMISVKKEI